jgi:hypothetical protein
MASQFVLREMQPSEASDGYIFQLKVPNTL